MDLSFLIWMAWVLVTAAATSFWIGRLASLDDPPMFLCMAFGFLGVGLLPKEWLTFSPIASSVVGSIVGWVVMARQRRQPKR